MAGGEEKSEDFYAVLGLKKECTTTELRNAYKKLAMKWHPDRCSALGNSKSVEEAKKKFQAIQQAYSVLSDTNKRFLYDLGVYDCDDDDDENGMGDFLNEMASMMSHKSNVSMLGVIFLTFFMEKKNESFEELQELFKDIFESDIHSFCSSPPPATPPSYFSSSHASYSQTYCISGKRNSSEMSSGNSKAEATKFEAFCIGAEHQEDPTLGRAAGEKIAGKGRDKRRNGRKQKISPGQDVSSSEYSSISA